MITMYNFFLRFRQLLFALLSISFICCAVIHPTRTLFDTLIFQTASSEDGATYID